MYVQPFEFWSQGSRFLVGFESDPAKLRDNPACPEIVGIYDDRSDSGYFECGLWGDVMVMLQDSKQAKLQIMELKAYSWDYLISQVDPTNIKSSCGPDHCNERFARWWPASGGYGLIP